MGIHKLPKGEAPPATATTTKDELLHYYKEMAVMRRMEIMSDILYKKRDIRGFCHLYDGQEAVSMGMESGMTREDCLITAYRCHTQAYMRGISTYKIFAEMMAKKTGSSLGKGGSMHYYSSATNFYGGNGIVGAQMPVGTGLAFALKYKNKPNFAVTMYGDGAASQGQLNEASNIAGLWKLPIIYFCENNGYGMGTSVERHSHNTDFYTRGDKIPGIKIDGQNILGVRETMKWAGKYVVENGPLYIEASTYRYHGHSMSDPGISYRDKSEVQEVRNTRDPLLICSNMLIEQGWATPEDLKAMEKEIRKALEAEVEQCRKDPFPTRDDLYTHIGATKEHYVRGVELGLSQNY